MTYNDDAVTLVRSASPVPIDGIVGPVSGRPPCGVPDDDGTPCGQPSCAAPSWVVNICSTHGQQVFAFLDENKNGRQRQAHADYLQKKSVKAARVQAGEPFVYYVQMPGDLIKIGTSRSVRRRMGSLTVGPDDLLALEPGSVEVESQRHAQFASLRMRRTERFHDAPVLREHIAQLIETLGRPVLHSGGVTFKPVIVDYRR